MLDPKIQELKRGDPLYAKWINELADMGLRRITGANGVKVRASGNKYIIEIDPSQIIPKK